MANQLCHIEELLSLLTDEKGYVAEGDRDTALRRIRARLENRQCFDCHNRNPTWLSMTYAVFICLTCSGNHRRMGTHISFVRSCELDKFTRDQLIRMELGGNGRALTFFKSHGTAKPDFYSRLAAKYKAILDKACQDVINSGSAESCHDETSSVPSTELLYSSCVSQPTNSSEQLPTSQSLTTSSRSNLHAETQPAIKPSPSYQSRVCSEYYEQSSNYNNNFYNTNQHNKNEGGNLGSALMAHAASTGGVAGSRTAKGKKLVDGFDFDEAFEEASTLTPVPSVVQPKQPSVTSFSSSPVINVYTSVSHDSIKSPQVSGYGTAYYNSPSDRGCVTNSVPSLSAITNSKYDKAKSISSAELFQELKPGEEQTSTERLEMSAKFRRFNDCKAISSEAFHAGDPTLTGGHKNGSSLDEAQLAHFGSQAKQGIQILASGAQNTVIKARDWFNNFVLDR